MHISGMYQLEMNIAKASTVDQQAAFSGLHHELLNHIPSRCKLNAPDKVNLIQSSDRDISFTQEHFYTVIFANLGRSWVESG